MQGRRDQEIPETRVPLGIQRSWEENWEIGGQWEREINLGWSWEKNKAW